MFMQPLPANQGVSRPFIVGLVMLLLFLSLQTDWTATRSGSGGGRKADFRSSSAASPNPRGTTRERIIYELSVSNDKLERENWQMRQHIFDLRRALRRNGTEGNETLVTFPELEKWLERAANHTGHLHFDRHKPRLTTSEDKEEKP